jgi:glucuronate isomerase
MKEFIGRNFLIENAIALDLYERVAKDLPIYDYHSHLSPKEIAENRVFYDVGELMLEHDHYKWRIMRALGIQEEFITGKSCPREKFICYAKALQNAPGNPLYHWTHMELKEYFGISEPLTEKNASHMYDQITLQMADGSFSVRNLIRKAKVEFLATTDDPVDSLEYHEAIAKDQSFKTRVVPTFRPDKVFNPNRKDFLSYIQRLGEAAGIKILDLETLLVAYRQRMNDFARAGCVLSDHGIGAIPESRANPHEAKAVFSDLLSGVCVTTAQAEKFEGFMLSFFAGEYQKRDWVMQLHLSAIRNQNKKRLEALGPDCGVDSVGDIVKATDLGRFFNQIESSVGLPRTIIYTLNPVSYYIIATATGNFTGDMAGKIQMGPAWWFCDHRDGILLQLSTFANTGVLGTFNGMLTDSRSFLSFIRHDYFRRILCSLIGEWIESGEYPNDGESGESLIRKICYENARDYFADKR